MKPGDFASKLIRELESLPERKTAPMRQVRRNYSHVLRAENAQYVLDAAHAIVDTDQHRWIAY